MLEECGLFLLEKVKKIPKQAYLPLGILALGMIFFVYGLIQFLQNGQTKPQVVEKAAMSTATQSATLGKELIVDVEGAVLHPGVYHLGTNARIQDALIAAGGISNQADRAIIAKQLNMATKLTDGMKVYIPTQGEAQSSPALKDATGDQNVPGNDLISINSASVKDLDSLPGIGPVTADKIIAGRPYGDIGDLVKKKVLTQKILDGIREKISL